MINSEKLQATLRSESVEHLSIPTIVRLAARLSDGSRHLHVFERLK